jgi:hypothetical protein
VTLRRGRIGARTATGHGAVLGLAALATVIALAAVGCAPAVAPARAATGAYHGLTIAGAQAAYSSYVTVSDTAAAHGNQTLGLEDVGDAQWTVVRAQYTALRSAGTTVPRYRYGRPVFYVPALTGFPQWFVVAVPRTAEEDGHWGATVSTLMIFERPEPDLSWRLDGSAVLGRPLPAIARDAAGYAVALPTTDPDVLLRPNAVAAAQAAVVDEGPANPAATVVASGPATTGLYSAQAAEARAYAATGVRYQWLSEAAPFPVFDLRLTDGGALVLYGMYLDTTAEHPNAVAGKPIRVPAQFKPLLAAPTEIGYHGVVGDWTYQYAAVDPPPTSTSPSVSAHDAKVEIIAGGGGPSHGHAW